MQRIAAAVKAAIELSIRHCSLSIIFANAVILIVNTVIIYQLLPALLNYPPDFKECSCSFSLAYWLQYAILSGLCLVFTSIATYFSTKEVDRWHAILDSDLPDRDERLASIRRKCRILPFRLYVYQIIIPVFILLIYSVLYMHLYQYNFSSFFGIIIIVMTFFSLTALINALFAKTLFIMVLQKTGIYDRLEGRRISLRSKMLFQILPISIVSILFTSMLGYSRLIEDRSSFLHTLYKRAINSAFEGVQVNDVRDIEGRLANLDVEATKTQYFIFKPGGELVTSDGRGLNRYFVHYARNFSDMHGGRIYDETGSYNGILIHLEGKGGTWSAGIRYRLAPGRTSSYLEGNFVILVLIILLIIYLAAGSVATDISGVTASLREIAAGWSVKSRQRVPITSNDEIGDLIMYINRIRDMEQEYDMMKNEFIANISHEFRTPLNIILNALQLSARYAGRCPDERDAARLNSHIGTMKQNCYRLLKLINNMIDSSKIEASFFKLYRHNFDIVAGIRQLTLSASDYIKDKDIRLEFTSNTDGKTIAVDPDALERIMLNLLSNAVKFSGRGSAITVAVNDRGDRVDISVRDTGIGIPAEKLQNIFKRFAQVDNMLTKRHEGSGIGLSIVKSLVELHNGSITVYSKPGEGTEFVVTLPAEVLPAWPEGADETVGYENRLQPGIEKIDIEFSDI